MKILFCTKCGKKIIVPKMLFGGNIKTEKPIKIACADANCSQHGGHALFKPIVIEQIKAEVGA